jgi:AcrR family transcriptional regulator
MSGMRRTYASARQLARQERILAAARALIAEKGYDGLTMRDLASASGVSDKTLYNLFTSKDRLVLSAVAELLDAIVQRVDACEKAPGLETLLLYSDCMMQQIVDTPAYAQAMATSLFQADARSPLVGVLLNSNERFLRRELRCASQRQELGAQAHPRELARLLGAHMWGVLLLWNKGLLSMQELSEASMQSLCFTLKGVANDKGMAIINKRLSRAAEPPVRAVPV